MDKRKLIGTIIGVTMFAALIAGATFAWLTFNATVTNATYNGTTMNFLVNYTKGQDISSMPQLVTATPETATSLVINAKKNTNSVDGYLTVKLTSTSTTSITTSGAVNWALCKGECSGSFTDAKATGTVTATSTISLWTDDTIIQADPGTDYYIYFWLDSAIITSDHIGQTYSGYIHASATQITE